MKVLRLKYFSSYGEKLFFNYEKYAEKFGKEAADEMHSKRDAVAKDLKGIRSSVDSQIKQAKKLQTDRVKSLARVDYIGLTNPSIHLTNPENEGLVNKLTSRMKKNGIDVVKNYHDVNAVREESPFFIKTGDITSDANNHHKELDKNLGSGKRVVAKRLKNIVEKESNDPELAQQIEDSIVRKKGSKNIGTVHMGDDFSSPATDTVAVLGHEGIGHGEMAAEGKPTTRTDTRGGKIYEESRASARSLKGLKDAGATSEQMSASELQLKAAQGSYNEPLEKRHLNKAANLSIEAQKKLENAKKTLSDPSVKSSTSKSQRVGDIYQKLEETFKKREKRLKNSPTMLEYKDRLKKLAKENGDVDLMESLQTNIKKAARQGVKVLKK